LRPLTFALIGAAVILAAAAGWVVASGRLGGGSSGPGASSTPGLTPPTPQTPATGPAPTVTATPHPSIGELALLYSQFGESEDVLLLAPVSDLQEARTVATVPHSPFWGISASLSPDGQWVAYAVLPSTLPNPEEVAGAAAEVWAVPLAGGEPQLLAAGADVRLAPIWSPDSRALVFQTFDPRRNGPTLFRVTLGDKTVAPLASIEGAQSVSPLAFAPAGDDFYVAQGVQGGTELLAVDTASGSTRTVATIAGVTRDWRLSPDGQRAAFIRQAAEGGWELWIVNLADGAMSRLEAEGLPSDRELFNPTWHPQQSLIAYGTAPAEDGTGVISVLLLGGSAQRHVGPEQGFDIPLAWSPQGDYLVVQEFPEYPVRHRGRLRLIGADGQRLPVAEGMEVTFIGWSADDE